MAKRKINTPKTFKGQMRKSLTGDGRKTIKKRKQILWEYNV